MPSEYQQLLNRKGGPYSVGHQKMYIGPIMLIDPPGTTPINILDIGFGIGFGLEYMLQRGFFHRIKSNYIGCEPDEDSFNYVNESVIKHKPFDNVKLFNCTFNVLQCKENFFDYTFCIEVIEHMSEQDLQTLLVKAWTYTKQAMFLSTPDPQKSKEGKWEMTYLINLFRQFQFNPVVITAQWTNLWILNPINK